MTKGTQQKILHKGSNRKINAYITLLYPSSSNKIKFKITKTRTSTDFIDHLKSIREYIKNNKIKRFILITDNASFHIRKKTKQSIELVNSNISTKIFTEPKSSRNKNKQKSKERCMYQS
jgi:pantothenate kinase